VNDWTFTGVFQNALPRALGVLLLVNCRRVPLSRALPLNCIPAAEKPELKSMTVGEVPELTMSDAVVV